MRLSTEPLRWLASSAAALPVLLAACGGGGGGSGGVTTVTAATSLTPVPAATPTPTPAPASPTGAMGSRLGLTQLAEFPTLSWLYRPTVPGEADGANLIRVGYDAARGLSVVTVPGYAPGGLVEFATETTADISHCLIDPSFGGGFAGVFDRALAAGLLVPGAGNRIFALEHTSVGWVGWQGINTAAQDKLTGVVVYGVPTAAGDRPAGGAGNYALFGAAVARASGTTDEATLSRWQTGNLVIDFGTSVVAGGFGGEAFATAQIAADGSFEGTLAGGGRFEGRFTGPQARELMLRWRAPSVDPATGRTETLFGVLAGPRP